MEKSLRTDSRDLLRSHDLDRADRVAASEIAMPGDGSTAKLWNSRFVRADVQAMRENVQQALG